MIKTEKLTRDGFSGFELMNHTNETALTTKFGITKAILRAGLLRAGADDAAHVIDSRIFI
jgi:hypothetical protein